MTHVDGWIDLSIPVRTGMVTWPGDPAVLVERVTSVDAGDVATVSRVSFGSHTGTHVDAPAHFIAQGPTLEAIPWDGVIGEARVLHVPGQRVISAAILEPYDDRPGERILLKTDNSNRRWWEQAFRPDFVHLDESGARYLASRGARLVGIDYLSVASYADDPAPVHRALLERNVWIVEGLNLHAVEPGAYELLCLPLRLADSDGAPARVLVKPRPRGQVKGGHA